MQQFVLSETPSIFNHFISELRDINIQKDSMRFRRNLERIGEIFAYEISKTLQYSPMEIISPLGTAFTELCKDEIVLATILRAGLPLHQGFLNFFDKAENAFITEYRKYEIGNDFSIQFEYLSSPEIEGKVLILVDPMLATGSSMLMAYKALIERGKPSHTHIVAPIASTHGVEYMKENILDKSVSLWLGVVDPELNPKAYIVPGIGDAGDLAFGEKL